MEVLDRYLEAVRGYLPREECADIVAELADDLRSEVEERQAEAGRPLSEDEVAALLKRRGHPMTVAERYLPPRYLIGPAMLPAYKRTVAVALGIILALAVAGYAVFSGPAREVAPALRGLVVWVWLFALVALAYLGLFTVIFALVERRQRRAQATGHWDPRDPEGLAADPETAGRRAARAQAVAEVAVDLLVLSWWLTVGSPIVPVKGITVTAIWYMLHGPVALFLVASIGVALADALRPSSARSRLLAHLALDAVALALVAVALAGSPWVRVGPGFPAGKAALLERWINLSCLVTLLFIGIFYLTRVVRGALRIFGPQERPAARLASGA